MTGAIIRSRRRVAPRLWGAWGLALALGGCAASQPTPEQTQAKETVEEILSQPLEAGEYATARRCISEFRLRDFQTLGDRYLVFEGPGDQLWLNEVRGVCPGLRRATALGFEQRGVQVCELDRFVIGDLFHWSRFRRWPWDWNDGFPCTLGKFQPVSAEQVESLRAALEGG